MIGQTISHYRILEKLGEGGMGVVYKAEDTKLHRHVALKFLPHRTAESIVGSDQLIREAQAAASLNHPNIATIFEFSEIEDPETHSTRSFIAMEYVEGFTLKEVIQQGPLPVDRIRSIVSQIARGLSTAHSRGIIHRDIKPSNLIITRDEIVKLLDFGIAKSIKETAPGLSAIAGSAAYMAPEVIQGGKPDKRSDLWAFGVLTFEMMTGKLPFRGDHPPAVMYSIVNEDPLPLQELRPDAPTDLARICEKCLEKDPDRRLATVEEIFPLLGSPPGVRRTGLALSTRSVKAILWGAAILIGAWVIGQQFFSSPPREQRRIAVLPFQNLTKKPQFDSWSQLLQAMLVGELTGFEGLGVVEPLTLNSVLKSSFGGMPPSRSNEVVKVAQSMAIAYLIDGAVVMSDNSTILQVLVRNITTGEQTVSRSAPVLSEEDLSVAVRLLAREIAVYLQIRGVDTSREKDLRPWTARQPTKTLAVSEFLQANQYIFEGIPGAEKHLQRAIDLDSSYIAPRVWLISGLLQRGRIEEAQRHYKTLRALESTANPFEQSMVSWAGAYLEGDLTGQSQALKMALGYSPDNNILLMNLARTRYLLGDLDGAIEALAPAVETRWQYSPAHYLFAVCYDLKHQPAKAEHILVQSLSYRPVYHDSYLLLAKYALAKNDSVRALEHEEHYYRRAKEVGIDQRAILLSLASNRLALGSFDKSLEYYGEALRAHPGDFAIRQQRADALLAAHRLDEASKEYRVLIQSDSSTADSYAKLGTIFLIKGDTLEALRCYRMFLRWDSTSLESENIRQRLFQLSR